MTATGAATGTGRVLEIVSAGRTHVGKVRQANQDYWGVWEPQDPGERAAKGRLYVVCDGMGGAAGGEVASKLGTEIIIESYKSAPPGDVGQALSNAITAANKAIYARSLENQGELMGMGSTAVALVIHGNMAHVAHDGDSRCYVIRNGELIQMTKDHSMVQQMLDAGLIDEDEVADHPRKNVIMRCMGVKPDIEVELTSHPVYNGDLYSLCTDGLWGPVKKEDVRNICLEHKDDLGRACQVLLDLADANGGPDNSTVILARVMGGAPAPPGKAAAAPAAAASPDAPTLRAPAAAARAPGARPEPAQGDPYLLTRIVVIAAVALLFLILGLVLLLHK